MSAAQANTLAVKNGSAIAQASLLALSDDDHAWYSAGVVQEVALRSYDAVVMRRDPPFDPEYLYATHILEVAEREGVRVVNRPRALRDFNEKLAILRFPQFTAPTLVASQAETLNAFIDEHGDVILKQLDGMGGTGIFRVRRDDPNRNVILETMTSLGTRTIMAQRYIPDIAKGDKRVLVIDGVPMPYCLARIPKQGETRGNLAAGGRGVAQALSARDKEIGEVVGRELVKEGLTIIGLDVIGDYLTEVNVTSPTCMVEIHQQAGFDIATKVIEALERT